MVILLVCIYTLRITFMSKSKNKEVHTSADAHDIAETALVRSDLIRIVLLNIFYLALVLVVYYADQRNHFLIGFFGRVLHW